MEARKEEIDQYHEHDVYTKADIDECMKETGKPPIKVRWIDINKGDNLNPDYRSRLVAKEIKQYNRDDLFAATPPLEALKMLISMAMTEGVGYERGKETEGMKLEFIDIKRAFFHAQARRKVYVELPEEDMAPGKCGKLNKSMYGTRDAAQNWEEHYSNAHLEIGFKQGLASTCVFRHEEKNITVVIHGDDFTALGKEKDLDWYRKMIMERMSTKVKGRLGPGPKDQKTMRVLNRIVEWTDRGIRYEADQRHAEIICRELGYNDDTKGVVTPGLKLESDYNPELDMPLNEEESSRFRAMAARANYLSQDRPDIQYATTEL